MQNKNDKTNLFLENRRKLLKLGAAGMPMVLTMRASAQQAVISQLRCAITVPDSFKILVDDSGAVWVGDRKLRKDKSGAYKTKDIVKFQDKADFVFPEGSAPESYRPDECEYETCDESGHSHGHDDDDDMLSYLSDENGSYSLNDYLSGSGGGDNHSHSQCDDDGHSMDEHGHSVVTNAPCGYAVYKYSRNYSITPGEFVNGSGNWSLSGDDGLYLSLAILYAEENGNDGNWPGVSCIVSVLNYIGQ